MRITAQAIGLGLWLAVTCVDPTAKYDQPEAVWDAFCKAYTRYLALAKEKGLERPHAPRLDYNCGIVDQWGL